jgi:hypothetical protein
MRAAPAAGTLRAVSFLGALLLVWSLLLVAGMVAGLLGPLAGAARDR